MLATLTPWSLVVVAIAGWINREQEKVTEYVLHYHQERQQRIRMEEFDVVSASAGCSVSITAKPPDQRRLRQPALAAPETEEGSGLCGVGSRRAVLVQKGTSFDREVSCDFRSTAVRVQPGSRMAVCIFG
ncbi:MAG: hypothetical protein A2341_00565 [Deltaproteobacteria bacterium RIFOXYB12_FULL_58_9]|nr:MAG: hypothetical protein A2341_00565 [Deltaproteobacteria bacterium RIFOXYB12_FULL_58_9]